MSFSINCLVFLFCFYSIFSDPRYPSVSAGDVVDGVIVSYKGEFAGSNCRFVGNSFSFLNCVSDCSSRCGSDESCISDCSTSCGNVVPNSDCAASPCGFYYLFFFFG
jgi:hypothetical protein